MGNALQIVSSNDNLLATWKDRRPRLISSCFGVDRLTGRAFEKGAPGRIAALSERLRTGYKPSGLLAIPRPKESGGYRVICVPTVADRLVQFSILTQLRPRLKSAGLDNSVSFGLAPGKARSVVGARGFACKARSERGWVYKTDIHKFFDSLDREKVLEAIAKAVPQRSLRPLIAQFVHCEVSDGIEPGWKSIVSNAGLRNGWGVRQGMPLSPFLAAAYLKQFDRWLIETSLPAARYVDDIVMFFDSEKAAREFHPRMVAKMRDLGLDIGDIDDPKSKTNLYAPEDPADFLGMEIAPASQGYSLRVSRATRDKVGEKLASLATVAGLVDRGVQLTTLGTFLSSIRRGYINAYDGADNLVEFEAELADLCKGAKNSVLIELFGAKLGELSQAEKVFVGLEPD